MNIPVWLKPGIYGAVVGAAVFGIVGFSWGGWMTGGSAEELANDRSDDSVIEALVPVCLDIARMDPDRVAKLAEISALTTFRRRDAVMEAGWATVPGSDTPSRDLAQACIEGLEL